ncbi:MAG: pyridoxamine 5'-phosphate oxidase family protein [Clostridiaceae bacterium]
MKKMRRADRLMNSEEAAGLLVKGDYGIFCTVDQEGQPYGTPVHYVFYKGNIYFHAATEGTKLDNLKGNDKVCFTVVITSQVEPEKFSTIYESVMAFGKASEVGEEEKTMILMELVKKYSPEYIKEGEAYIEASRNATIVVKIEVESFSGKHRI